MPQTDPYTYRRILFFSHMKDPASNPQLGFLLAYLFQNAPCKKTVPISPYQDDKTYYRTHGSKFFNTNLIKRANRLEKIAIKALKYNDNFIKKINKDLFNIDRNNIIYLPISTPEETHECLIKLNDFPIITNYKKMAEVIKKITSSTLEKFPKVSKQGIKFLAHSLQALHPTFWLLEENSPIKYFISREAEFRRFLEKHLKNFFMSWASDDEISRDSTGYIFSLFPKAFAFMSIGGQNVLAISSQNPSLRINGVEQYYVDHIDTNGCHPTWNQVVSSYVNFSKRERMIKFLQSGLHDFDKLELKEPTATMREILNDKSYLNFKNFSHINDHPDYKSIYSKAVCSAIEGISDIVNNNFDNHKKISIGKLLMDFERVMLSKNENNEFYTYMLYMFEEFKALLIDNPYSSDDYQSILFNAFPYPGKSPTYGHAICGMAALNQCVHIARDLHGNIFRPLIEYINNSESTNTNQRDSISHAITNMLNQSTIRRPLRILMANDNNNYFENEILLNSKYDEVIKLNPENMGNKKFDIIVVSIDPVISDIDLSYTPIDIPLLLNQLHTNNLIAKNATLICDATTGSLNHPKLHKIIEFIDEKNIDINLMAYASATKLLSLGIDNIQGAVTMLIPAKNNLHTATLKEQLKLSVNGLVKTPDFQYLCHILKYCHESYEIFVMQLSKNARYLLDQFEKNGLVYKNEEPNSLIFASEVDKAVIYFPYIDLYYSHKDHILHLLKYLNDAGINLPYRSSFGYPIPTYATILEHKIRISPGLLPKDKLDTFAKTLVEGINEVNQTYLKIMKNLL